MTFKSMTAWRPARLVKVMPVTTQTSTQRLSQMISALCLIMLAVSALYIASFF